MKNKNHYPTDFDSFVFRAKSLPETCQCIYDSGCRKTILEVWAKNMDASADKDEGRGRKKLAHIGRQVALILGTHPQTIRDKSFDNLAGVVKVGESIAQLRYDVMLRVAYHLRLSQEARELIFQMFRMSASHMKHELTISPPRDHLQKYTKEYS